MDDLCPLRAICPNAKLFACHIAPWLKDECEDRRVMETDGEEDEK